MNIPKRPTLLGSSFVFGPQALNEIMQVNVRLGLQLFQALDEVLKLASCESPRIRRNDAISCKLFMGTDRLPSIVAVVCGPVRFATLHPDDMVAGVARSTWIGHNAAGYRFVGSWPVEVRKRAGKRTSPERRKNAA